MSRSIENFMPAAAQGIDASAGLRAEAFMSAPPSRSAEAYVPPGISSASFAQVISMNTPDTPVTFTVAGQGPPPDYILGADGNLTKNPAKTSPSPDGSITIQVGGSSPEAAKAVAKSLQVATVQSQIDYWQRGNPGKPIPHFLQSQLASAQSSTPDVPAPQQERTPTPQAQSIPQDSGPAPSQPMRYGGQGSQSVGPRDIGPAPSSGYRGGGFEQNGPSDRSVVPPPVAGDIAIKGPPSATVEQIQTFLDKIGSPAAKEQGFAQALYDETTRRGIDPAMAVGFFLQESTCGRYGRAHENHSLGNIKGVAPESGGTDGTFRKYATWTEGVKDWARLIDESYAGKRGLETLSQVISVYAPSSDNNNESKYVATVKGVVEGFKKQNGGNAVA